jgi:hypothetical protein
MKNIGGHDMEKLNRYGQAAELSRPHRQAARQHHPPIGRGVTYVF